MKIVFLKKIDLKILNINVLRKAFKKGNCNLYTF